MGKIKNIEFLRVVGCIAIVFLHFFANYFLTQSFTDIPLYNKLARMTMHGQKAVDLFFIISGLFFALTLDTTKTLFDFLKKKLIRLYPVLVWLFILIFIASLFKVCNFTFYDNILELLCLGGTSLVLKHYNLGIFWYVSALLWVLVFYFYLFKNYEKKNVHLFLALTIFFCYSYIIHAKNGIISNNELTFDNIYNVGMMRALAGTGLGYFIGYWYSENIEKIKKLHFSLPAQISLTVLEFVCMFFIINNLILHSPNFRNNMLFIVAFVAIIVLFLIKKGFISRALDNSFWSKLSKYTYSIYMTHVFILTVFKNTIWIHHKEFVYSYPELHILIVLALILVLGILTYHFIEIPCFNYFKSKNSKRL